MKKKIKINLKLTLSLLVAISITSIYYKMDKKVAEESIQSLIEGYKFEVNEKDSTLAYQKQIILDKNSEIAKLADTIQGLKNQTQRVRVVTRTVIKHDTISIEKNNIIEIDSINYLELPFSFSQASKWYSYSFTLRDHKVFLDSLILKSDLEVVFGEEDHGAIRNIFKENSPIVTIINKNPYSSLEDVKNYKFEDFRRKRVSLGFQIGFGATNSGFSPYAGLGINFRVL